MLKNNVVSTFAIALRTNVNKQKKNDNKNMLLK